MNEPINHEIASFNQAQLQQLRIHDLFREIDLAFSNLFTMLYSQNGDCIPAFNLAFNNLCSVFLTCSVKMTDKDFEEINDIREEIINIFDEENLYEITHPLSKKFSLSGESKKLIEEKMFMFRREVEKILDKYGYGNPSKEDQSKAIAQN
jgi:hypothetical protein